MQEQHVINEPPGHSQQADCFEPGRIGRQMNRWTDEPKVNWNQRRGRGREKRGENGVDLTGGRGTLGPYGWPADGVSASSRLSADADQQSCLCIIAAKAVAAAAVVLVVVVRAVGIHMTVSTSISAPRLCNVCEHRLSAQRVYVGWDKESSNPVESHGCLGPNGHGGLGILGGERGGRGRWTEMVS